jgi:hypothetical protein
MISTWPAISSAASATSVAVFARRIRAIVPRILRVGRSITLWCRLLGAAICYRAVSGRGRVGRPSIGVGKAVRSRCLRTLDYRFLRSCVGVRVVVAGRWHRGPVIRLHFARTNRLDRCRYDAGTFLAWAAARDGRIDTARVECLVPVGVWLAGRFGGSAVVRTLAAAATRGASTFVHAAVVV